MPPLALANVGARYDEGRRSITRTRQEGLTETYNRVHDHAEGAADIKHLRDLHVEMDQAVATAYGWTDLDLGHGFHETKQGVRFTVSERARQEVLARPLRLNHERYAAETAHGLHDKRQKKAGDKRTRSQTDRLFDPQTRAPAPSRGEGVGAFAPTSGLNGSTRRARE